MTAKMFTTQNSSHVNICHLLRLEKHEISFRMLRLLLRLHAIASITFPHAQQIYRKNSYDLIKFGESKWTMLTRTWYEQVCKCFVLHSEPSSQCHFQHRLCEKKNLVIIHGLSLISRDATQPNSRHLYDSWFIVEHRGCLLQKRLALRHLLCILQVIDSLISIFE